jgi:hypothetical protein
MFKVLLRKANDTANPFAATSNWGKRQSLETDETIAMPCTDQDLSDRAVSGPVTADRDGPRSKSRFGPRLVPSRSEWDRHSVRDLSESGICRQSAAGRAFAAP